MENQENPPRRRRTLRSIFSLHALAESFKAMAVRYPLAVVYTLIATVWLVESSSYHHGDNPENVVFAAIFGIVLSVAAVQWSRYLGKPVVAGNVVALILPLLVWLWLDSVTLSAYRAPTYIACGALMTGAFVAAFFLPGFRSSNQGRQVSFTASTFFAVVRGAALSAIFLMATSIILFSIHALFNVDLLKAAPFVVMGFTLPVLFILADLPRSECDGSGEQAAALTIAAVCRFVLLPLALIYMAVLYVYGAKILFTWSLPRESVSAMVIGLSTAVLVIIYAVQGYLVDDSVKEGARRTARLAVRVLPLLVLPLLLLMSVAIFYRIGQYGITPSRLYVAAFNLWCWGAVIYIYLTRGRRLDIVAVSAAVLFIAVSVVPGANFYTWGISSVQRDLRSNLEAAGVTKFPISYSSLVSTLRTMPKERRDAVIADIEYLDDYTAHTFVRPFVTHDLKITGWELRRDIGDGEDVEVVSERREARVDDAALSPVPQGYSSVEYVSEYYGNTPVADGCVTVSLRKDSTAYVTVPVDSLLAITPDEAYIPIWLRVSDGSDYILMGYTLSEESDTTLSRCNLQGYIFKR